MSTGYLQYLLPFYLFFYSSLFLHFFHCHTFTPVHLILTVKKCNLSYLFLFVCRHCLSTIDHVFVLPLSSQMVLYFAEFKFCILSNILVLKFLSAYLIVHHLDQEVSFELQNFNFISVRINKVRARHIQTGSQNHEISYKLRKTKKFKRIKAVLIGFEVFFYK